MSITRIVVAHRPALVDAADDVYRIADGAVAAVGSRRGGPVQAAGHRVGVVTEFTADDAG